MTDIASGYKIYPQVVAAWNGMAISAFAMASRVLASDTSPPKPSFPADRQDPSVYLDAAVKVRAIRRTRCSATVAESEVS